MKGLIFLRMHDREPGIKIAINKIVNYLINTFKIWVIISLKYLKYTLTFRECIFENNTFAI